MTDIRIAPDGQLVQFVDPADLQVGDVLVFEHGDLRIERRIGHDTWLVQDDSVRNLTHMPKVPIRPREDVVS